MKVTIRILFIIPIVLFSQQSNKKNKINTDDVNKRLNIAVQSGLITQKQADKRLESYLEKTKSGDRKNNIEHRFKRLGLDNIQEIKSKLKDNNITDSQLEMVLPVMLRLIHILKDQGKDSSSYPRITQHLENKIGLTDVQIKHVLKYSHMLARRLR